MPQDTYIPPFTMTEEIINIVIEIAERSGKISLTKELSGDLKLRRENRIKTIYSSLAIEQNTLTFEQISDIIAGKIVLGPPQDIREAKNAYETYEMLMELNPYAIEDLLKAHRIMMADLVKESGVFRSGNVGVYQGDALIHAGTPARYVPDLVNKLFNWLSSSELHPLIKSCIFHYEFEFIHPFADGNGRMGRLWHTLILSQWQDFFQWLPIETLIYKRQQEYYKAINHSNAQGESTVFVHFMLKIILDSIKELSENTVNKESASIEEQVIFFIRQKSTITAKELAEKLRISERQVQRVLKDLKDQKKIERLGSSRSGKWNIL